MRILLSEASSPTSRQVAGRLGELGHEVEVLSSTPLCIGRFTRHVRAVHRVPRFGTDPLAWCDAAVRIAQERQVDMLFPTQEQVTVLSERQHRLGVATVVPDFASLARVQDKVTATRTLAALGILQPETLVLSDVRELSRVTAYPAFVKRPVSSASRGVRRVINAGELGDAVRAFGLGLGGLGGNVLVVQTEVRGRVIAAQAIADRGRLIAHHATLRLREGAGGSAALKQSVTPDGLQDLLTHLVGELAWHGPLALDVIERGGDLYVIDVNPRLVEPVNALDAGVDLIGAMLELGQGGAPREQPAGLPGMRTHQALMAILGAALNERSRGAVLREAIAAFTAKGPYTGSHEELTPLSGDPLAAIPVAMALVMTLIHPLAWRWLERRAASTYAVSPEGWQAIVAEAAAG